MDEPSKKEIIVKGINLTDHPKVGPKIGVVSREGEWFNSLKSYWVRLKEAEAWGTLAALVAGDRLEIRYNTRSYTATDGSEGLTKDIIGFEKIIQKTDEVKPVTAPKECLPRETPPFQEWSPKQTCLKSATDLLVARIGNGYEIIDLEAEVLRVATKLYKTLREPW